MSAPLLEVAALSVAIGGTPILRDLSFKLGGGEVLGLVGASGCGKSMTALALMRLLPRGAAMQGAVRLCGEDLTIKSDAQMRSIRGRTVGMVFQEPMTALNPLMSIGAQVAETVRLHGAASRKAAQRAARDALDAVGLSGEQGALDRLPFELSGGQRQRVAIAMALAVAPPLLIADEPTTALDVITQAQVLTLLKDLARSRHMGLLLITHDLAVVAQLTDRVAVMQSGRILEQDVTHEVLRHPRHSHTQALIAAAALEPGRGGAALPGQPVLCVSHVVKEYPRRRRSIFKAPPPLRALDDVSLLVHAGETVGVVGESGSGKSSLLKVILALHRAEQGGVALLGENFSDAGGARLRTLRRAIQAVFQDPRSSFDGRWTVADIVAEPFFLMDTPPDSAERHRKVAHVLSQVGLMPQDATRFPHEFSGGQRQRIAIARALITQPAVIAFDEAVSALDVLVREQILQLLAQLAQSANLAYLFVTHDLHVIRAIADRIYVMQRGRIVEHGTTAQVFDSPQHEYTRALIAATPRL